MTKDILAQYCDLKEEVKDLRRRIENIQRVLDRMESEGLVADTVKGGYGGKQRYTIRGFPYADYSRRKSTLRRYQTRLETAEERLLELTNEVEDYIQSLDDSRIRRILRYRFLDNLTWRQVAYRMGGRATEDSIKKEFQRFMKGDG